MKAGANRCVGGGMFVAWRASGTGHRERGSINFDVCFLYCKNFSAEITEIKNEMTLSYACRRPAQAPGQAPGITLL